MIDQRLFEPIDTIEEAKRFMNLLKENGLAWHFDESPEDCLEEHKLPPVDLEKLAIQRDRLYDFDWGDFECPIGFLLEILNADDELHWNDVQNPVFTTWK